MRFYFGKSIFSLFLGLLCFNTEAWFTIAVGVVLFVVCVLYIILGIVFFQDERDNFSNEGTQEVKRDVKVANVDIKDKPIEVI